MAVMELDQYESHLDNTEKCTGVATEIHPYYEKVGKGNNYPQS